MRTLMFICATAALSLVASCTPVVHAGCSSDGDCPVRCEEGHPFPNGLCTQTCDTNDDCPPGSLCIDERDGICLLECSSMQQCDDFGHGYICKDKKDVHGDKQLVCLGD